MSATVVDFNAQRPRRLSQPIVRPASASTLAEKVIRLQARRSDLAAVVEIFVDGMLDELEGTAKGGA